MRALLRTTPLGRAPKQPVLDAIFCIEHNEALGSISSRRLERSHDVRRHDPAVGASSTCFDPEFLDCF
jgi:hypothetical protein